MLTVENLEIITKSRNINELATEAITIVTRGQVMGDGRV